MQIPELSWIMRFHFRGSENIYKALETSEPHQKLHGEVFSHTVHFCGLQIPKTGANSRVFSLKLFLCNSHSFINSAIWKYSSVLDKFWSSFGTIHRINHLWFGEEQSQFSVAWICLIPQQKSARGSPGKQVWMWCKHDAMLRSKSYDQELATPQDLNKSLLFSFFDLVNSSKFKTGKKKKSLLPAVLENTAAGDHTQESRV